MSSLDQKKHLWITAAGGFVMLAGFAITVTLKSLVGSILILIGALTMLASSVMFYVASRSAIPKVPKSVEEQRQVIRDMANDIRQKNDN